MMSRPAVAMLALLAIAGCAQLPEAARDEAPQVPESELDRAPVPVPARARDSVGELVGGIQGVATMRPDAQRRELNDAIQSYARNQSLYARLRLALLFSLPGTPFWDDARAVGLLETPASPAAESPEPLRQFGAWLHGQIGERVREQRRATQLKEQIDALRAIERSLNERGSGRSR